MHTKTYLSASVAAAVTMATVGFVATNASADSAFWTHPVDEYGDPTGDIRGYSLAQDTSTFTVSVALGAFDLASA